MVKNKRKLILILTVVFGILFAPNDYMLNAYAEANNSTIHYTIKKGDTFYFLSNRFNSSVNNISSMNPKMDPLNLRIGSKIKLPVGSGIKIHHVKNGDTLWNIADTYNSTIYTIAEKNYIGNPNLIYRGDILAITKSPEINIENPAKNTVPQKTINAIVSDLNHSKLNARYENGWIKMDNINFNLSIYEWSMSIVKRILDNHNVKIVDYTTENVQWEDPRGTLHWGTVCIKVGKKSNSGSDYSVYPADEKLDKIARDVNELLKSNNAGSVRSLNHSHSAFNAKFENVNFNFDPVTTKDTERFLSDGGDKKIFEIVNKHLNTTHPNTHWGAGTTRWGGTPEFSTSWLSIYAVQD